MLFKTKTVLKQELNSKISTFKLSKTGISNLRQGQTLN